MSPLSNLTKVFPLGMSAAFAVGISYAAEAIGPNAAKFPSIRAASYTTLSTLLGYKILHAGTQRLIHQIGWEASLKKLPNSVRVIGEYAPLAIATAVAYYASLQFGTAMTLAQLFKISGSILASEFLCQAAIQGAKQVSNCIHTQSARSFAKLHGNTPLTPFLKLQEQDMENIFKEGKPLDPPVDETDSRRSRKTDKKKKTKRKKMEQKLNTHEEEINKKFKIMNTLINFYGKYGTRSSFPLPKIQKDKPVHHRQQNQEKTPDDRRKEIQEKEKIIQEFKKNYQFERRYKEIKEKFQNEIIEYSLPKDRIVMNPTQVEQYMQQQQGQQQPLTLVPLNIDEILHDIMAKPISKKKKDEKLALVYEMNFLMQLQ